MTETPSYVTEPIAIVGSACRFPGDATTPAKLWELLRQPQDVLREIPPSRFSVESFYHPDNAHHGTSNVRHSYILSEDHRLFDAQFFGTKPIEANSIDPQQRILLETVYEGLESAGIPMEKLQGSDTGVYVGLMTNDYADILGRDIQNFPTYFASGTARSILSNRISYYFDWHGPSMTIDTACSSSLIALHQAVQSLRNGECKVAVAAGTNLLLGPEQYVAESKLKMLSPNGQSKMWDKDADGYARGDGIAAVILKSLSAAISDGDHIECLVRETGINQDGRTKGITMPNPVAQADLIRSTYQKAGLDLSKPCDRPQYFEAHGTGTPAGDPVEAEAISTAFFGNGSGYSRDIEEPPLYVGSIKTVIGHTEGTAGLAAIMKASLALQNATIPPNLLLRELHPAVQPFYNDLEIPLVAQNWPSSSKTPVRRASVNSFGFGGANAHAILESCTFESMTTNDVESSGLVPCNFSANSEQSLLAIIAAYSEYLEKNEQVRLRDLLWTLNCRRSTLPVRLSLPAANTHDLRVKLQSILQAPTSISVVTQHQTMKTPNILGIFTGQGAQWARMGAELLDSCVLANKCIASLDMALQSISVQDRPKWTLREEIPKSIDSSRIAEAIFSQTICTAVQILLIDLIHTSGLRFHTVVGHSSGEIAAAYAAGYICAEEAIIIAYYRGWSLQYSNQDGSINGAMMVAGTSFNDADELCEMPSLKGRICVAASNSSDSVTLSGDADAVKEAMEIFEDERKFNRLLKVDKAYHSHHMLSCAEPYLEGMQRCPIRPGQVSEARTTWISSVYATPITAVHDNLGSTYWVNNMIKPVLFSQAVSYAISSKGPFDMAIEVGPHPALKGPSLQTIQEISGQSLPYSGTLTRGTSGIEAFASMLGSVWTALGSGVVDYERFEKLTSPGNPPPKLLKDVPSYKWDHDRIFWHESRVSTSFREEKRQFHPLLGTKCPDGTVKETRWRNYLDPREIPWLAHHQIQGQIVFPAAGYISAATELIVDGYGIESLQLIDFQDVVIGQALTLDENSATEVIFAFTVTETSSHRIKGYFNCYSDSHKSSSSLVLHASTQAVIMVGDTVHDLPPVENRNPNSFFSLETERFYNHVAKIGFGYTGPFVALSDLRRKMDQAIGTISVPNENNSKSSLLIHPAALDGAIQSIMLAFSFPGDGRLDDLHLPTGVEHLRVNVSACRASSSLYSKWTFYSSITAAEFSELSGDVDIYSGDGQYTIIQLEGLHTTPLTPLSVDTDIPMFTEITWAPETPSKQDCAPIPQPDASQSQTQSEIERVAFFYLRQLCTDFDEPSSLSSPLQPWLVAYAYDCVSKVRSNQHPSASPDWINDTLNDITAILHRNNENPEMNMVKNLGQNLAGLVRSEIVASDIVLGEDVLRDLVTASPSFQFFAQELARIAGQISNRFPHINLLEIGVGNGEITHQIISEIGTAFGSYTYTDSTDSSLDIVKTRFGNDQPKVSFKILNVEEDVDQQGYSNRSYDLVVVSANLSTATNIERCLVNIRRLMKAGGYMLLLEPADTSSLRLGLIFGCLSGRSLRQTEGSIESPCLSDEKWTYLMRNAGFTDIDVTLNSTSSSTFPFHLMLCQATDDRVNFLRDPFAGSYTFSSGSLTIVGGATATTASLVQEIQKAVLPFFQSVNIYHSLAQLVPDSLPPLGTALVLTELDHPVFQSMIANDFEALKDLFKHNKSVVWVGKGAQSSNPFSNMYVGIQRTLMIEMDHLRVQFLDMATLSEAGVLEISKRLLQFMASDHWDTSALSNELLWYTEPELRFENGRCLIPRLKMSHERNNRYNSSRRLILKEIQRNETAVTIIPSDSGCQVHECGLEISPFVTSVDVQVTNALLRTVQIGKNGNFFLLTAREPRNGNYVVALSDRLTSDLSLPPSCILRCGQSENEAVESMLKIYRQLLARSAISSVPTGRTLAVLDPDYSMLAVLECHAEQRGVQLLPVTTKNISAPAPWVYVHPQSTRRVLSNKLPKHVLHLFDATSPMKTPSIMLRALPSSVRIEDAKSLTGKPPTSLLHTSLNEVNLVLRSAWEMARQSDTSNRTSDFPVHSLTTLIKDKVKSDRQTMVTMDLSKLSVQVLPASKLVRFSRNKTYWLIGLTGGLGRSISEWMARQGARYIALSSRKPALPTDWIDMMASRGCTVRVFATDITDRDSVRTSYENISQSMPPITGVAQGAMVLKDTMFFDLDLPRFEKVLRPKVQGTILLDELFSENELDFMILFSSMASITGNPGQVAYNAANTFMSSLASQRRSRGLATQAINIGVIVGNGYVTRELNHDQQSYLYRTGHNWMSEHDLHEILAEGIFSCLRGDNSSGPCSGLRIDDDQFKKWYNNPMFQHLVLKSGALETSDSQGNSAHSLKMRLIHALSESDVMGVLEDSFTTKMHSALQSDPNNEIIEMSPDELGVDSLVAVDIRSWFLRELGVDMPVLKIFNAASLRELLDYAFENLPSSAVPNLNDELLLEPEMLSDGQFELLEKQSSSNLGVEAIDSTTESDHEGDRNFHIQYPSVAESESENSSASILINDSSCEQFGDTSTSSTSIDVENDVTVDRKLLKTAPMSMTQKGFWFLTKFVQHKTAFNVTPTFELSGKFRTHDFIRAAHEVAQHHEATRTFFFIDDCHGPTQGIWEQSRLQIEHININHESEAQIAAQDMAAHIFNLSKNEAIRMKILSLGSERHWILIGFHHILMDGASFEIFWSHLETVYNGHPLPPVLQYPDFANQQSRDYEQGKFYREISYWKSQFHDIPEPIPLLPYSLRSDRPQSVGFSSHIARVTLDQELSRSIKSCCHKFRVTPFHFHLATWNIFLLRHLDLPEICIGLGDANRTHPDIMHTIGLFLNTVPLRFPYRSNETFGEVLKLMKSISQNAFANARLPFDAILQELKVPRSASYNPLFQTFFNFRQNVEVLRNFCGCHTKSTLLTPGDTAYDLQLDVTSLGNGDALIHLLVQKDLYGLEHANLLLRAYQTLLKEFCRNPATHVSWPPLWPEEDIRQGLESGKSPEVTENCPQTIIHRLDAMVSEYPQRVALKETSGKEFTYIQLQERIGALGVKLLDCGVHVGARVAVFLSPSADWICSLFAILRIGATYIPLDRKVGLERLATIACNAQPLAVVFDSTTAADLTSLNTEARCIDITHFRLDTGSPPPNMALPDHSAMVMYTSGSTGIPKGISIRHSAYMRHLQAFCATWDMKLADETILHQSSYAWDMSIFQIFTSAFIGGTLVIADSLERGDPVAISHLIVSKGVTITSATPTEYLTWLRHSEANLQASHLKMTISGGEFMPSSLTREFRSLNKKDLKVVNAYGPAEITFFCSYAEVPYMEANPSYEQLHCGLHTLPNYSITIVDANLEPVPLGVPGEILVGGPCVAQGYLDHDQTKEKFIPDRHASHYFKENNWDMAHRTGDRGKLTREHGLVLLGRISGDNQIKLNGIRLNVEEIEKAILAISSGVISQAVVSSRNVNASYGDSELILVAFVVMNKFSDSSAHLVQVLIKDLPLPSFMRPAAVVPVPSLPQNASGKIDRLAISKLTIPSMASKPCPDAPITLENKLRDLWKEVIPHEVFSLYHVNSSSDFFHVGGSSLSLVSLQSLIAQNFEVSVPLHQLFEESTLRGMAQQLHKISSGSSSSSINWETEVQDLVKTVSYQASPTSTGLSAPDGTKTVILTGATGFIGREILRRLVSSDSVRVVYCIAVRKPKEELPILFKDPKVQIYHGDLGLPRLGLSATNASLIFSCADLVIHNGADVSFMKTYQSLKLTNIASMVQLIKLSLPRRVKFHFVSSASVTRLASSETFGQVSVASYPPPSSFEDGYTATKWVSEVLLEQISRKFNLCVYIHRPSSVTGDGAPDLDLMANVLKYCQETQMIPDLSSWSGMFDLVSVESVGSQIVETALRSTQSHNDVQVGEARFVHECGEIQLAPSQIKSFLELKTGQNFKTIPLNDWIEYAERAGMSALIGIYLRQTSGELVLLPRLIK